VRKVLHETFRETFETFVTSVVLFYS